MKVGLLVFSLLSRVAALSRKATVADLVEFELFNGFFDLADIRLLTGIFQGDLWRDFLQPVLHAGKEPSGGARFAGPGDADFNLGLCQRLPR